MDRALYLEVLPWRTAATTPGGPPRLLIGDAALLDVAHLRFHLSSQALAPSLSLARWARARPLTYWRFAEQYRMELDHVASPLFDRLCSLARHEGLTLLVPEARTGSVIAGYLRDWATRTPPIERRLDNAWRSSREAAIIAAAAADAALKRVSDADEHGRDGP